MNDLPVTEAATPTAKLTPDRAVQKQPMLTKIRILAIGLIIMLPGCTTGREFRDAALPAIESGALSIATGLLEGLFAAIAVDPQNTQSASSDRR